MSISYHGNDFAPDPSPAERELIQEAIVADFIGALDALEQVCFRPPTAPPGIRFTFDQWLDIKLLADRFDQEGLT